MKLTNGTRTLHKLHTRWKDQVRLDLGEFAPKKAKVGLSTNKVMATVLQKGRTIIGEYYAHLFSDDLKKKTTAFGQEKSSFPPRQCKGAHMFSLHGEIL